MSKRHVPVLLSLVLLFGCREVSEEDIAAEQEKVRTVFTSWVKDVVENQNADTYFNYVTDDFMIMEAGAPPLSDRDKIKAGWVDLFAASSIGLEDWQSQEVIVRDDIAIHRYTGIVVIKSKSDTSKLEISLKYLDILKKDKNGEWKVYIHSNSPNK